MNKSKSQEEKYKCPQHKNKSSENHSIINILKIINSNKRQGIDALSYLLV